MKSKKKTIIISVVVVAVLLIAVIVGVVLIAMKRYDMTPNDQFSYNNHTNLKVVNQQNMYTFSGSSGSGSGDANVRSNGTVIVDGSPFKGVYSLVEDWMVIPQEYTNIYPISLGTGDYCYKCSDDTGRTVIFSDDGTNLGLLDFTASEKQNYGYIKQRNMDVFEKRSGVKVSTKSKFSEKRVAVNEIEFVETYYRSGDYHYELWRLRTPKINYLNLYKVNGNSRELVQTLNNVLGNSVELSTTTTDMSVVFLKNGTPRILVGSAEDVAETESQKLTLAIYDINLKEKGRVTLSTQDVLGLKTFEFDSNLCNYDLNYFPAPSTTSFPYTFMVGNAMYFQKVSQASEDKYDFSLSTGLGNVYCKLTTYKFNLSTGKLSTVNLKYLVSAVGSDFNSETAVISACKISKKSLEDGKNYLVNDRLQLKEISYDIDSITRITKDRLLVSSANGYSLIDNNYKLICSLGKFSSVFTTSNAIVLRSNSTGVSFVCTLDGTVVARYNNDEISCTNDDKYYLIKETTESSDVTTTKYYLENLGVRQSTPIYTSSTDGTYDYSFNGTDYQYVNLNSLGLNDSVSVYLRIRKEQSTDAYVYDIYSIDGRLLYSLSGDFSGTERQLTYIYSDDDHVVLYLSTGKGSNAFYLLLDR